jgi:hypothetical protein
MKNITTMKMTFILMQYMYTGADMLVTVNKFRLLVGDLLLKIAPKDFIPFLSFHIFFEIYGLRLNTLTTII